MEIIDIFIYLNKIKKFNELINQFVKLVITTKIIYAVRVVK